MFVGEPVEILGWRELPFSGDEIIEVDSEKQASSVLRWRQAQALKQKAEQDSDVITLKQLEHDEAYKAARRARQLAGRYKTRRVGPREKENVNRDLTPRVNVIIKGDVHGSVEAILDVLETYHENDKCRLDIVHYGVGDVIESDLEFARTFNAIIYAFSVQAPKVVPKGVKIREMKIIYRLVEDLKREINAQLPPTDVEESLGEFFCVYLSKFREIVYKLIIIIAF